MAKDLKKAFERRDDYTLVDPREYYGALGTADKDFLSELKGVVDDIPIGSSEDVNIPGQKTQLRIRKLANDMYSGWTIDENGDITHLFDRLTLPAVASQIKATQELYEGSEKKEEKESLKEKIKNLSEEVKNHKSDSLAIKMGRLIEKLSHLNELATENTKTINVLKDKMEKEPSDSVLSKLEYLSKLSAKCPKKVLVSKTGTPDKCEGCGNEECDCFRHLSKPSIQKSENGKLIIHFGDDYNTHDRINFLKQMKFKLEKGMDAPPPPPPPAIEQAAPQQKVHRDSSTHLKAIADVETSGGKNLAHKKITNPKSMHYGHTAGGSWGFMPKTVKEVVSGRMGAHDLSHHKDVMNMDHQQITHKLNTDHEFAHDLAASHHAWLMGKTGNDHKRAAHAWYHGLGATRKVSDEEVGNHPYVKKYLTHYNKHKLVEAGQKQAQKHTKVKRDPFSPPPGIPSKEKRRPIAIEKSEKGADVSSIALLSGNKILMGKRRDTGKWTLPGGHCEKGENPLDGAVRELAEETGISRERKSFTHLKTKGVNTKNGKKIIHAFKVECREPSTTMTEDPDVEVERWHWINIENDFLPSHVAENLHSPKNVVLEALGIKSNLEKQLKKYDYSLYDEIAKNEDTTNKLFVAFDGDNIGAKVEQAAMKDDLAGIKEMHNAILRGQKVVRDYGKRWNADIYIDGGDDIAMILPRGALRELESVRERYKKETGHTITAGIGDKISRAGHALLYGKLTGKDKAVVWSPKVDKKLEETRKELTPAEKLQDHGLLSHGADNEGMDKSLKDIKTGPRSHTDDWGRDHYDYNHLISDSHKKSGYSLSVRHSPGDNTLEGLVRHKGKTVGTVTSDYEDVGDTITTHSAIHEDHRGKGLGSAAYEAVLSHAHNALGVKKVKGGARTPASKKVHQRLQHKHGMKERGVGDGYEYVMKSKDDHIELHHYSKKSGLDTIHPGHHGSGYAGAERKRKGHPDWVDRSYHYVAGEGPPEHEFNSAQYKRYTSHVPKEKIYDLASDPEGHRKAAQDSYGVVDHTKMERHIKDAGHLGYRHTGSALPHAVALFHPVEPHKEESTSPGKNWHSKEN